MQPKNIKPTKQEIVELKNIRELLICKDPESVKLGKDLFFKCIYYKRILRHKNLRVDLPSIFIADPYKRITKKLVISDIVAILDYILNIKYSNNIPLHHTCFGLYYMTKVL